MLTYGLHVRQTAAFSTGHNETRQGLSVWVTYSLIFTRDFRANYDKLRDAYELWPEAAYTDLVRQIRQRLPDGWARFEELCRGINHPPGKARDVFIPAKRRPQRKGWTRAPAPNHTRNGH